MNFDKEIIHLSQKASNSFLLTCYSSDTLLSYNRLNVITNGREIYKILITLEAEIKFSPIFHKKWAEINHQYLKCNEAFSYLQKPHSICNQIEPDDLKQKSVFIQYKIPTRIKSSVLELCIYVNFFSIS